MFFSWLTPTLYSSNYACKIEKKDDVAMTCGTLCMITLTVGYMLNIALQNMQVFYTYWVVMFKY